MDAIAVYAAVLSTVIAAWNVWTEVESRKPRLRVDALMQMLMVEPADLGRLRELHRTGQHQDLQWRCDVSVVNVGRRPVFIDQVQLRQSYAGSSGAAFLSPDWDSCKLEPGQRIDVKFLDDDSDVDLGYPLWAEADTDAGSTFKSELFGPSTRDSNTVVVMPGEAAEQLFRRVDPDGKRIYRHTVHDPS